MGGEIIVKCVCVIGFFTVSKGHYASFGDLLKSGVLDFKATIKSYLGKIFAGWVAMGQSKVWERDYSSYVTLECISSQNIYS